MIAKMPPILKHFECEYPSDVQVIVEPFRDHARWLAVNLPDGEERAAGLRKLLEARDCMLRAYWEKD